MRGAYAVFYREMIIIKRRIRKILASYSLSPMLFLIAFGWGMGKKFKVEGVEYISFMIPGLIAMSSMTHSFDIASEINIARFYWHIFDEFMMAPIPSSSIVLGEIAAGMIKGLLSALIIFLLSPLFSVPVRVNISFIVCLLVNTFMFSAAAVIIAMIVKTHADQAAFNTFVIVPMSFLCGTFFSLKKLPRIPYIIAHFLPLTHSSLCIRATFLNRALPVGPFLAMIGFAVVFYLGAVQAVKRSSV